MKEQFWIPMGNILAVLGTSGLAFLFDGWEKQLSKVDPFNIRLGIVLQVVDTLLISSLVLLTAWWLVVKNKKDWMGPLAAFLVGAVVLLAAFSMLVDNFIARWVVLRWVRLNLLRHGFSSLFFVTAIFMLVLGIAGMVQYFSDKNEV